MPVINILSPHVADLIAAGEVVDRPANVVKELVENAIDAGAKSVTVEIDGGGAERIRVTDDGCGMSPEDAHLAFLRHATSKLRDERGLEAIGTLGFRGEALAAIAAVSRVTLQTRRPQDAAGTELRLEAGDILSAESCGCPVGTRISVEGLFYNTPARRKFLRSDKAEAAACAAMAQKCALGRPELSLRCIKDGQELFFSPGDGRAESAVYALLGREFAAGLLPCRCEAEGVTAEGFVSAPHAGRGSRAGQYFFVNGRNIRSPRLQAAVEQAYQNRLLTGRFPSCVIYLTLNPGAVDVNVHPTKSEVRFSREREVFDAVYHAVLGALEAEKSAKALHLAARPEAPAPEGAAAPAPSLRETPRERPAAVPGPRKDFFQSMTSADFRRWKAAEGRRGAAPLRQDALPYGSRIRSRTGVDAPVEKSVETVENSADSKAFHASPPAREAPVSPAPPEAVPEQSALELPGGDTPLFPAAEAAPPRLVGEVLKTYILVERGDTLLVIDKHAAHERILFDRLRSRKTPPMPQLLLEPIPFSPGPETAALLLEQREKLEALGFQIEPFGADSVLVRAAPAELRGGETALLEEVGEALRRSGAAALGEETLSTMACKAAVKAGSACEPEELLALAEAVLSGEVKYCPHGRPVAVALTRKELDKQFDRIQ